jgi:outer membrane protein TolC
MKANKLLIFMLCLSAQSLIGQDVLQGYIQQAIATSDVLKQQNTNIEQARLALEEARRLFRPNSALSADYFVAAGGRTVDFPVGDILNPVYSTLNQLTQSNNFPQLENQRILLNPSNFYDVKLRTSMPVINPEIKYVQRIKEQQMQLEQVEIVRYTHELTHDVKAAYYTYLKAAEAVRIYQTAIALAEEGLRANQSLFKNDKVNRTAVVRAEQEVVKYKSQREAAEHTASNARSYFNFLLNRAFTETIDTTGASKLTDLADITSTSLSRDYNISKRQELQKLSVAQGINTELVGLAQAATRPKLNAFVDLGAQNFKFRINSQTPYLFGGLSMKWDLYTAGRNKLKIQQNQLSLRALDQQTADVRNKLNLQLSIAQTDLANARAQHNAAQSQVVSAERYYTDMQRLYREGMAMYIELLDAQNQLIINRLQANIARFEVCIKAVEVERAAP